MNSGGLGGGPLLSCRIRHRRQSHPLAIVVRLASRGEPLTIAWPVTFDDAPELIPIDRTNSPVFRLGVVGELGIRQLEVDRFRLRDGEVHETLTQLVVALLLDAPAHQLIAVRRLTIRWTEHHE